MLKKTGIIYRAINKINGKCYIGQTIQKFKMRVGDHKKYSRKSKSAFYNAVRKYGWESFEWEIMYNDIPTDQLDNMERWSIANFDTLAQNRNGYNTDSGGNSNKCLSEEHKNKIRKSLLGRKRPKEVGENISKALIGNIPWNKGKTHKDDLRIIGGANHPNFGKKENMPTMYGKKHTEETKKKISEGLNRFHKNKEK